MPGCSPGNVPPVVGQAPSAGAAPPHHTRRMAGIRMTLLTTVTERLFWHCGAHTAEPKVGLIRPIPHYQSLLFSVARARGTRDG